MCSSSSDPRDAAYSAALALRGLQAILADRHAILAGDAELPMLLELISDRLYPAAETLLDYVPRGFVPPDA
ncbi:hypothetical protein [Frigidibacter oleivorans]|uniref:hypothetical protein n=1 Tax=Frigidibacter oleivorans TaxID=2487129 RepID=UPI000F8E178B|nr:hypothetical protein [Frigidibacter oleivorans]